MSLIVLLIKQQLVFIYFKRPELLEEFTDCETDVFVHVYPPQQLSLNNIFLCGFDFCIHSRGRRRRSGEVVIWQFEINKTCHLYKQRWALRLCLLLWCDLLVSVQPWMALCATAGPGGEALTEKETVVDLGRQMGQYIKWVCGELINRLI